MNCVPQSCACDRASVRLFFVPFLIVIATLFGTPFALAQAPTDTQLSIAPATSVSAGTILTFTATVTASGTPLTSGQVTFCDMETAVYCEDSAVLGRVWLTRTGTATLKTALSFGGHNIQAVFQGTNAFSSSSSAVQTVSVLSGPLPTTTTLSSVQYYGYGGLNQAQVMVRGAPIPVLSGSLSLLDATNANYPLTSFALTAPTVGYTPLSSIGGVPVQRPEYTVAGDFNGDGYLDFVVASNYANSVQVYLGNGDGSFSLKSTYTSSYPAGLNIADFNGDGYLDFAVLNSNSISVYLGIGDGTFSLAATPSTGNYPYAFAVADLNGDGIPDFVYTNNYTNRVQMLLGVGDGTFVAGNSYPTGKYPEGVVAADFNRDGLVDIAAVNQMENTVTVLLGTGGGGFTAAPVLNLPATPYALVAADFNGDGITDLAVTAIIQGAEIYLGNGDGTFGYMSTVSCGTSGKGYGIATTDFNADGKPDLIVGKTLFTGDGFGNFKLLAYTGGSGSAISVGDFNGDGSPDLITPVYSTSAPYNGTVNIALEQASFSRMVSSIKVLGPGTHNVYASYGGDSGHSASQSSQVSMTGAQISTTTALTISPATTVNFGTTVQFTATISPSAVGNYVPSGTVTFKEGTTVLGTGTVSSGIAAMTTNTLSIGSHTIVASYGGDANFLSSNSRSTVVTVNGGQITPTITWPTPSPIVYGTALDSAQLNADSGGVAGTFAYTPSSGTILPAGTQTLSTTFTPTDTGAYTTATASVQLTVQKATPTVSAWPTAGPINYGQTLASSTLTGGTASVAGTFAFTNPTLTPATGTSTQSVTFTPNDAANYSTVTGTVSVTVNPASQTITVTVSAPANASYNSQFTVAASASSGLPVTYSAAGGCTNSGATFTMTSGTTACTVMYDQAGDANHASAAQVVQSVAASKANPTVSVWPTATAITYGQALAASTLTGGTASVPGTFAFTTPGTVPPMGTSPQSVTFTPTDTSNYNSITGSVNVTVNLASQTITVTVSAPAIAPYNSQFMVAASASSGLPITYTAAGGCTNAGATFTMTSSTISCTVKFDQAGDPNYAAAPQVVETVSPAKGIPDVTAWPIASPITYGQSLVVATLTGGMASVPGSFAFTNPIVVLAASTSLQSVTFTPTDTANYGSVNGSVSVTVHPATLTVTADNVTRTYGTANPALTVNYTGFVNGDTAAILSGTPSLSTAAVNTSPVGSYAITVSAGSLSAANYTFVFLNGTLSVTPATLTIRANDLIKTYGQALVLGTNGFSANGLQNGESVGAVTLTSAGTAATAGVAGSPYVIVPSNATGGTFTPANYNMVYVNGALSVNKATTLTTVTDPGNVKAGTAFTVPFSVAAQISGTPTGSVTVTATDSSGTPVTSCSSPLTNGAGSCTMTIGTKGFYTLTAVYSGDSNFLTSNGVASHHAN